MLGREKIAKVAKELADHFQLVENMSAIKQAQRELADAIKILSDRLSTVEANFKVAKAEIGKEAMQAAYAAVHSVQSGLNERIEALAIKVATAEYRALSPAIDIGAQQLSGKAALPNSERTT